MFGIKFSHALEAISEKMEIIGNYWGDILVTNLMVFYLSFNIFQFNHLFFFLNFLDNFCLESHIFRLNYILVPAQIIVIIYAKYLSRYLLISISLSFKGIIFMPSKLSLSMILTSIKTVVFTFLYFNLCNKTFSKLNSMKPSFPQP